MSLKSHIELIQKFIDELPNSDTSKQTKEIPNSETLDIRFQDVDYTHSESTTKLFDKLNLRIYPRQNIALLGTIGCGKSSLVRLIARLQTFQGGAIYINGVPTTEIDINNLRSKIIYIPQHPKLFNRTLRENLLYGLPPSVTIDTILDFMREHGFDDLEQLFIKRMDEKVGKNAGRFSGGQLQIIWLLRAFLKPCSLICTDEPTSSLDPTSKAQVKQMLKILGKTKAIILITHDMDMIENVDRVITFEKGKIISDVSKNAKIEKRNS